ncbi:MAG: hypothetical protein EHM36_14810, partial [Deltaproteobacteria bacterium]
MKIYPSEFTDKQYQNLQVVLSDKLGFKTREIEADDRPFRLSFCRENESGELYVGIREDGKEVVVLKTDFQGLGDDPRFLDHILTY